MNAVPTTSAAVEVQNPLPAGTRLQEFVIERALGVGGFGIVYQAHDTLLSRTVAIKEYMPTSMATRSDSLTVTLRSSSFADDFETGKATFIDEARMLARFKHPALIEVFRFWEQNGTAYMATPFYNGHTLKELLRLKPGVPHEAELKLILMPVLDALEHMHAEQVYHRDISPENIMVTDDGTPILLDLGAARRIEEHNAQAFTVLVKPGYAPIEQYAGDTANLQGAWTDLYGWAASAYFALAGKPPPPAASRVMNDSIVKLVNLKPAGYSHDFLAAIDAALAVRPDDRPQSVAELKMLLAIETPVDLIPLSPPPSATEVSNQTGTVPSADFHSDESSFVASVDLPLQVSADVPSQLPADILLQVSVDVPLQVSADSVQSANRWIAEDAAQSGRGNSMRTAIIFTLSAAALVAAFIWIGSAPAPAPSSPGQPASIEPPAVTAMPPTQPLVSEVKPVVSTTAPEIAQIEKAASARFAIKPWGEIFINGERRGVSPPMKAISLSAGEYNVEIRNGDYPPYKLKVKLQPGQVFRINHAFVDALQ